MADSPRITLSCSCGSTLAVPMSAAGKKTKCPKCSEVLNIPVTRGATPSPSRSHSPPPVPTRGPVPSTRPTSPTRRPAPPRVQSAAPAQARTSQPRRTPPPPPVAIPVEDDQPYGVAFDDLVDEAAAAPAEPAPESSCPECGEPMAEHAVLCLACGYDSRSGKVLKTKRHKESGASEAAVTAGKFIIGIVLSSVAAIFGIVVWLTIAFVTGVEIGWIAWGLGGLVGLGMRLGYRDETQVSGFVAAGIAFLSVGLVKGLFVLAALAMRAEGENIPMVGRDGVFHPFDILFIILAVATAYKVASGGGSDD